MIKQFIAVGIGGAAGSMLRFLVSLLMARYTQAGFPFPTLVVNLTGCFLIGLLVGTFSQPPYANSSLRLLLITGFCGGYTTFSAFANENLLLIEQQQTLAAVAYTLLSVLLGIALVWVGVATSKVI
jgi:crcB protein